MVVFNYAIPDMTDGAYCKTICICRLKSKAGAWFIKGRIFPAEDFGEPTGWFPMAIRHRFLMFFQIVRKRGTGVMISQSLFKKGKADCL
jgi:hypothetical protein